MRYTLGTVTKYLGTGFSIVMAVHPYAMGPVLKMWLENEVRLANLRAMGNSCVWVIWGADTKNQLFPSV
jgi:hypothetical protein